MNRLSPPPPPSVKHAAIDDPQRKGQSRISAEPRRDEHRKPQDPPKKAGGAGRVEDEAKAPEEPPHPQSRKQDARQGAPCLVVKNEMTPARGQEEERQRIDPAGKGERERHAQLRQ